MIESPLVSTILTAIVLVLMISLPILVLLFIVRAIRYSTTPQQKETQRLLAEVVEQLKEINRLLSERGSPSS
jgi:ABC-type bacteriocin/lantibiotic exporter with double-glycine peptidase domain